MTLDDLRLGLARSTGRGVNCYREDGTLRRVLYCDMLADVERLQDELAQCGVRRGDVVGLGGANGYEWIVADLALIALGCVSVAFPVEMIREGSIDDLGQRYELDAILLTRKPGWLHRVPGWVATLDGRQIRLRKRPGNQSRAPFPSDAFTLAFSSGTTGKRKCLVVSRKGIENTIVRSASAWEVSPADNILLFMPFSSIQQRTMLYMAIWFGFDASVVTPDRLFKALQELRPTLFIVPPSFLEALEKQWRTLPALQRIAQTVACTVAKVICPKALSTRIRRLLFRNLHERLGGSMRLLIVGSAPSRAATLRFFRGAAVPLYEVYGVNEFGWVSLNLPGRTRIGSVGKPLPGVSVRIAADGELIVSGMAPQTLGYRYDGEDEQVNVYLSGDRIATGDTGLVDRGGYVHLTGRKKNVIVTRAGYKINPEAIEEKLQGIGAIARAAVLDDREFAVLTCVAWMEDWKSEGVRARIQADIDRLNKALPSPERIGRVIFRSAAELTVESGVLTRNFKLNRVAVLENLAKDVAAMTAEPT